MALQLHLPRHTAVSMPLPLPLPLPLLLRDSMGSQAGLRATTLLHHSNLIQTMLFLLLLCPMACPRDILPLLSLDTQDTQPLYSLYPLRSLHPQLHLQRHLRVARVCARWRVRS